MPKRSQRNTSEVSNQTEANVIATDSTTVEPIKTEAPTVTVDKPVVAKTLLQQVF